MTATRRRVLQAFLLAALALPTVTTLVGCGDESKTGGTQVREDEKSKAIVNDMQKDMMNGRGK